jgi:hypothetical protein
MGWYRRIHDGRVQMRLKYDSRVGGSGRFTGRTITDPGWHLDGGLPCWPALTHLPTGSATAERGANANKL